MGRGHTCRESSNPRNKGRCDCGEKIDQLNELQKESHNPPLSDNVLAAYSEAEWEKTKERIMEREARLDDVWNANEDRAIREFNTGATRDADTDKLDYEGFLSPRVLTAFAEYMHRHRIQANGSLRDSDNWQKGIPPEEYMKSMFRHFMEVWTLHRSPLLDGDASDDAQIEALCALLFNVQGYMYELIKTREAEREL